jgi:hypothetical protein
MIPRVFAASAARGMGEGFIGADIPSVTRLDEAAGLFK